MTTNNEQAKEKAEERAAKEDKTALVPVPPVPIKIGPDGWVIEDSDQLKRVAAVNAGTSFAPKGMGVVEVAAAMTYGMELNLRPMTSLANIAVINGRPALFGDIVLALVNTAKNDEGELLLVDFSESFEGKKGTDDYAAVCEVKRAGRSNPIRQEFSVADAKMAGLWGKTGPWTSYPRRMLQMRARGFALRDAFPDVLKGVRSQDEARDIPPAMDVSATVTETGETVGAQPKTIEGLTEALKGGKKGKAKKKPPRDVAPEPQEPPQEETAAGEAIDVAGTVVEPPEQPETVEGSSPASEAPESDDLFSELPLEPEGDPGMRTNPMNEPGAD